MAAEHNRKPQPGAEPVGPYTPMAPLGAGPGPRHLRSDGLLPFNPVVDSLTRTTNAELAGRAATADAARVRVPGRLKIRKHLSLPQRISAAAAGALLALTGTGLVQQAAEGHTNYPPIAWFANQNKTDLPTTHGVDNATATAPATATKAPEVSPYATAAEVNQYMASLQTQLDQNPQKFTGAIAKINSDYLHNGQLPAKLGINREQDATGAPFTEKFADVGIGLTAAYLTGPDNAVLVGYTQTSQGKLVVVLLNYEGTHVVHNAAMGGGGPETLTSAQIVQKIGDGKNHTVLYADASLIENSGNPKYTGDNLTADAAFVNYLKGGPRPTFDIANPTSLASSANMDQSLELYEDSIPQY